MYLRASVTYNGVFLITYRCVIIFLFFLLYVGCLEPAEKDKVWPCRMSLACAAGGGEHVLYGWGKNAAPIHLPEGSGFSVGPGTAIRTVVLQVHYLQLRESADASGVKLHLSPDPIPYSAGLIAFASGFTIPQGRDSVPISNECCYSGFEPLHGFAFRVHTHKLGRSVFLEQTVPTERKRRGVKRGATRVAEQDPQLPQGFYPMEQGITIMPGDKLKNTCDFNSTGMDHDVYAGHTSADEMCNLYLMLYGELPFFMWCVDGNEWIHEKGPGGFPELATADVEDTIWKAPHMVGSIKLPPEESSAKKKGSDVTMQVGQVGGITTGADGVLWAFHRAFRVWSGSSFDSEYHFTKDAIRWPAVLRLDRDNGSVLSAWGEHSFFMPHMISLTPDGDVLVVDAGAHQLYKYSPEGKLKFTTGEFLSPGSSTYPLKLCKPTHAVAARDGTIYLADGYCNARVLVLSHKGEFHASWEIPRPNPTAPDPLPHSLALDECRQRLYVADREAGRVLAVNLENGEIQGHWSIGEAHGLPYAVHAGPYGSPVVLTWDRDGTGKAKIVVLSTSIGDIASVYELPGVNSPHDFTILPAPLELTGAGERKIAVIVAETAPKGSKLRKFVISASFEGGNGSIADLGEVGDQPAGLAASHAGQAMLKPVDARTAGVSDAEKAGEIGDLDATDNTTVEQGEENSVAAGEKDEKNLPGTGVVDPGTAHNVNDAAAGTPILQEQPQEHVPTPVPLDSETPQVPFISSQDQNFPSESFSSLEEESSKWWQKNPIYAAWNDPSWNNQSDNEESVLDIVFGYVRDNPIMIVIALVLGVVAYSIVLPRIAGARNRAQGYRNPDHMA